MTLTFAIHGYGDADPTEEPAARPSSNGAAASPAGYQFVVDLRRWAVIEP